MRQKSLLLSFAILLALIITGEAIKFRFGRHWNKHGNLGLPKVHRQLLKAMKQDPIPAKWFDQKLDHFDTSDSRIWKQRYFVNDDYFNGDGPVLIQLGGEGVADPIWLRAGQIATNYGKAYRGLLIYVEHRYYGDSHPTSDMSTENLRYLSSEQALADFANFIYQYKQQYNLTDNKWIAYGGSYSGSLAAWLRLKYPSAVDGAVASSAPMLAELDFSKYLVSVKESLGLVCSAQVQTAFSQVQQLLDHPLGWRSLTQKFNLCEPLNGTDTNDVANFMASLVDQINGIVQYNKDNRAFEGAPAWNLTIDQICSIMSDSTIQPEINRFAKVNEVVLAAYNEKCLDYTYKSLVDELKQVSWNSSASEGGRQWTYQTCTEFGFFQSTDETGDFFGNYFPVDFFEKQCVDIFGHKFSATFLEAAVNHTNVIYGGYGYRQTNVVFPNGSVDPWHKLGLTGFKYGNSVSVYMNGTAHCADLYPSSSSDPQALSDARNYIRNYISSVVIVSKKKNTKFITGIVY